MANFGRKPDASKISSYDSYKIFMSTILFCGVVAWMGYRAALSAQFVTKITKYPFNDLNSLAKSTYT